MFEALVDLSPSTCSEIHAAAHTVLQKLKVQQPLNCSVFFDSPSWLDSFAYFKKIVCMGIFRLLMVSMYTRHVKGLLVFSLCVSCSILLNIVACIIFLLYHELQDYLNVIAYSHMNELLFHTYGH